MVLFGQHLCHSQVYNQTLKNLYIILESIWYGMSVLFWHINYSWSSLVLFILKF